VVGLGLVVVLSSGLFASCTTDSTSPPTITVDPSEAPGQVTSVPLDGTAATPGALLADPDGSLLIGDRLTGRVDRVGADGRVDPEPVAVVEVADADGDQRGLLGLARSSDGRLFASWTRAEDGRLVVGELADKETVRLVWLGPVSADAANGGRLVAALDGLVIGIGDLLQDRGLADGADVPNRKVLWLDPDGPDQQSPRILSTGWNNPFALAVGPTGEVWVADNTGGEGSERLGRADQPAGESASLGGPCEGQIAPAGLVVLEDSFAVCGFLSERVDRVVIAGDAMATTAAVVTRPCPTGVVRLTDGRLAMGTDDGVVVTTAPVS